MWKVGLDYSKKIYICFNNQQIFGKDVSVLHEYATAFTL